VLAPTTPMLPKIKSYLHKFKIEEKITTYSGKDMPTSIVLIVAGAALYLLGFSLTIAWIVFCFGTIIIGVLLLLFSPSVLIAPLTISIAGQAMMKTGLKNLNFSTPKKESLSLHEAAASVKKSQEYFARMEDKDQMERVRGNREKQRVNMSGKSLNEKLNQYAKLYLITLDDLLLEMGKAGIHKTNENDTFSRDENKLLMMRLSDSGNAIAQFGMGEFFYIDKKYKHAIDLWNEALLQENILSKGHLGAISHNIGLAYYSGLGLAVDKEEAIKWLIKSALIEESPFSQHAAYKLAEIYHKGDGIKKNTPKAKFWANRATKGNSNNISFHAEQFLQRHEMVQIATNSLNEDQSPYEGINWENEMPTKKPKTNNSDDELPF